jgi:hypothetical protein
MLSSAAVHLQVSLLNFVELSLLILLGAESMPGSMAYLDVEQFNSYITARTLAYVAVSLYIAAVLAEILKRVVAGKKRPPKAFLLVRYMINIVFIQLTFMALQSITYQRTQPSNISHAQLVIFSPFLSACSRRWICLFLS